MCKNQLIVEKAELDSEAIVGEECHIVSGKPGGPRYDPSIVSDQIDCYDNLILLCRNHHKLIDDQPETFSASILHEIKKNHEKWVSERLSKVEWKPEDTHIRRIENNIPRYLVRLNTGKDIIKIVGGAYSMSEDHDELQTHEEVELVGSFLQNIRDWGDLYQDLESSEQVQADFALSTSLKKIEEAGFCVFGAREFQSLEGGNKPSSVWPAAILRILRNSNPAIIRFEPEESSESGTPPRC
jgi:hypothetical protein